MLELIEKAIDSFDCADPYLPQMKNDLKEHFRKTFAGVDIEKDLVKAIKDYKLEVNGSFKHKLSDVLIAKDTLLDLIELYFSELKKELDNRV